MKFFCPADIREGRRVCSRGSAADPTEVVCRRPPRSPPWCSDPNVPPTDSRRRRPHASEGTEVCTDRDEITVLNAKRTLSHIRFILMRLRHETSRDAERVTSRAMKGQTVMLMASDLDGVLVAWSCNPATWRHVAALLQQIQGLDYSCTAPLFPPCIFILLSLLWEKSIKNLTAHECTEQRGTDDCVNCTVAALVAGGQ